DTIKILRPINDATELLSGSSYLTIGDVRIVMMSLLVHLDINSVKNVNSQVEVASTIKAKLEVYWSLIHQSFIIATLLNSRTKFSAFFQDDQPHAKFTLQKMYDEYNPNNIQTALPRLTSTHSIFRALIQSTSSNNQYNTHEIEQYFQLPLEADHINSLEW
ncbi:3515_t:CDS:1, partial [Ambispora gerdemannii]